MMIMMMMMIPITHSRHEKDPHCSGEFFLSICNSIPLDLSIALARALLYTMLVYHIARFMSLSLSLSRETARVYIQSFGGFSRARSRSIATRSLVATIAETERESKVDNRFRGAAERSIGSFFCFFVVCMHLLEFPT